MLDDERDDFLTPLPVAPNAPDVRIIESRPGGQFQRVVIREQSGGYQIESSRDHPVVEYDRSRFRLERDPASNEQMERFRIVPKG